MAFHPPSQGGGSSREPSDEGSQMRMAPQLVKSTSFALRQRGAREDLNSTHALVMAYNQAETEEESSVLHQWLQQYTNYIDANFTKNADEGVFEEIACLAKIRPQCRKDKKLMKRALFFLGEKVNDTSLDKRSMMNSLANALQAIDESVFDGDPSALLKVADILLSELDNARNVFTKATHNTHAVTLFALYQTLLTVQRITTTVLDRNPEEGMFQDFKAKLGSIAECQSYFPFFFQLKIIEQTLDRLLINSPRNMVSVKRRVLSALCGCAYVYSGARKVLMADMDVDSVVKGYEKLKDAIASQRDRSLWYDEFVKLNGVAILASQIPDLEREFVETFHHTMEVEDKLSTPEEENLLRLGIVDQMHVVALNGKTLAIRGFAVNQLVYFGTDCVSHKGWDYEPAIVEAILLALGDVYARLEYKEVAEMTIEAMCASRSFRVQEITESWLEGKAIEEKARTTRHSDVEDLETFHLFHAVRNYTGVYSHGEIQLASQELRSKYMDPNFVKVGGNLEEERLKSVETFQFHIVYDEEVLVDEAQKTTKDQLTQNFQRTQRIRKTIALEDIFADRPLKPKDFPIPIKKVLLFGNPGSGKTSISKKIANAWAQELWGSRFKNVYHLTMRALNKETFNDPISLRAQVTLQCAIANKCYHPRKEDDGYKMLLKYIRDRLDEDETLVILDGLDESDEVGKIMLHQAAIMNCGLLLLTRPYNLNEIRTYIQLEMECTGLSDKQLEDFVKAELRSQGSMELLTYLKTNPSVEHFAHIPVIANILCFIWREKKETRLEEDFEANLFALYEQMAFSVFARFLKKFKIHLNRDKLFKVLEGVAFEALNRGQIQISQAVVRKHNEEDLSNKQIRQCGFFLMHLEGTYFQFAHLTFQEFFAGRWLALNFFNKEDSKRNDVEKFIRENKYEDKFRVTIVFAMQAICSKYKHDGLIRLLNNAEKQSEEKVDEKKQVIYVLNVIEAYITSESGKYNQDFRKYPIIKKTIAKTVSILRRIKNAGILNFGDDKKQFLRDIESLLGSVAHFEDLFIALRDGLLSDNFDCVRHMVSIAAKVGKNSTSHAKMLIDFLCERCTHLDEESWKMAIRALDVVAKQLIDQHETILMLAEGAFRDGSHRVRLVASANLHGLAREMPNRHEAIFALAEGACRDESEFVRRAMAAKLHNLAREMPGHHESIFSMAQGACRDGSKEVRLAMAANLHGLAREMPDRHESIFAMAEGACQDKSPNVRECLVKYLHDLAKEMPECHEEFLMLARMLCRDRDDNVRSKALAAHAKIQSMW